MDQDVKNKLMENTREHAITFIEDLKFLERALSSASTNPATLRHASVVLRRWLVEDLLRKLANPRVGKLEIETVDNRAIHRAANDLDVQFFQSAGAMVHGVWLSGIMKSNTDFANRSTYQPDQSVVLNVDNFRKQRVIFSGGQWFDRDQVIKFVANVAGGVHAGVPKELWETEINGVRRVVRVRKKTDELGRLTPMISLPLGSELSEINSEDYSENEINVVFLEILSTFHFVANSKKIKELVKAIESELGLAS